MTDGSPASPVQGEVLPVTPPPAAGHRPDVPARGRRRWWLWGLIVLAATAAYAFHLRTTDAAHAQTATAGSGAGRGAGAARPVPVLASKVTRGNFDVYLTGLIGTVSALNTVTVHSRVDGQLVSVGFREGEFVHQGDLLAEIDPRAFQVQLEQAQGQLSRDQATLQNAKLDLERYKVLYAEDSVAKQQLDTQQATVTQDEGAITTDQAQIDSAKLNLSYARITAPISGRIGLRLVDPGNIVHASDSGGLLVITQVQPIAVVFPIPEDALPRVAPKVRAGIRLPVDAFDRDPSRPTQLASGAVLTIDNAVDVTTGTVKVKATFPNDTDRLFPNQFVNVRVLVETLTSVVIAPSAAVERGPQSTYVFVVKPDGTVDMRTVEVQLAQGDQTVIRSGLQEGDTVVTDGLDKLQQGTHVEVRPPAAATGSEPANGAATGAPGSPRSTGAPASAGSSGRAGSRGRRGGGRP